MSGAIVSEAIVVVNAGSTSAGKQLGVLNQPRILQATESIRVLTGHY